MPFSFKVDNWPMRIGIVIFIVVAAITGYSIYEQMKGGAKIGLYPPDAGTSK